MYDNNFTNITNNEEVNLIITHGYMNFKSEFYGLNKNVKDAKKIVIRFIEIVKLTITILSKLTNINKNFYLKLLIPRSYTEFFGLISQNADYVKSVCNDKNIPFHFA